MNPRKILNAAREGIGDPEEIRRALVECGELDGGCFEVALLKPEEAGGGMHRQGIGRHLGDQPFRATSKHLESEHLSYRLGGKL